MKLHLPVTLFKALLVTLATVWPTVDASTLRSEVSFITYTDFGQNMGRYKTDTTANDLLLYLRQQAGGVKIEYQNGDSYTLEHHMPDFTGAKDHTATDMALGYNATVTVKHNGVFNGNFTSSSIDSAHSIFYQGIEYRTDSSSTFLHTPKKDFDHKVTRISKVITDVQTATLFSGTTEDLSKDYLKTGELLYRAGSGIMSLYDTETKTTSSLASYYTYVTGGIDRIDHCVWEGSNVTVVTNPAYQGEAFVPSSEPLPFGINQGDSGSPTFIYNKTTQQYEFIAAASNGNGGESWHKGSVDYVRTQLDQYDKVVTTTADTATLHIGKISTDGKPITATVDNNKTVSTTPCSGRVTDDKGNQLLSFAGVRNGISTWDDLSGLKDTATWYAYDNEYLNAAPYANEGKELTYADLFVTDNLVFEAKTNQSYIVLDATVDLGIGYAQFLPGSAQGKARFDISSGGDGSYQFNHAGYVIGFGADVHTTLTGSAEHMYEWRKVGEGNLHIEGKGKNDILLNVGGRGSTYLNREDGYAAYNVLANTHTTVVISDTGQIARDFTFGHEGGVLDMHGNSMIWNNDNKVDAEGFTIHALDEHAIVANLKDDSSTVLTWTQNGARTFLGSFQDNGKDSQLQFVYQGGEGSTLTLHSIRTSLKAPGSGMIVESGTLVLAGTHTVHGQGSLDGRSNTRYSHEDDWHYADASSNVTVRNGGTFELGSHARLTGDVVVESGGTFIMREGVRHEQEYIEGGEHLESTSAIAEYHGLKGNIQLDAGATLKLSTNTGTTAICSYNREITGEGNVVVSHADTGSAYCLGGTNTFTGSKTIERGGLIAEKTVSLGDVSSSKWKVGADGWIAVHEGSMADLLKDYLDSSSTGTLALSTDSGEIDLSSHKGLHIGAETGKVVNYGAVGTTEALKDVDGAWRFGGPGGKLQVNYQLSGEADLLVHGVSDCTIVLNNKDNDFTGTIKVQGGLLQTQDLGNDVILDNGRIHYTDIREGKHDISHVSGNGTVGLNFTDDLDSNELITDGDTNVTVHLQAGGVTLNQKEITRDLILEDGTSVRMGQSVSAATGTSLTVTGRAELHSGSDCTIALGEVCGAGELVNKSTGSVTIAAMNGLTAFTHDTTGSLRIEGGAVQSLTQTAGTATLADTVKANSITVNGGKLNVEANKNNQKRLSGSITVNGGELCFSSGGSFDTLDFNDDSGVIRVTNNGRLDFGETRQTMGAWKIILEDGAHIAGNGDPGLGAMDFNQSGSTIYATKGASTISAITRLNTSKGSLNLNYDVSKDATLTVTGCIQADATSAKQGQITKKGDGILVLNEYNFYDGGTTISGGTLRTALMENLGNGTISIATGARLEITAQSGAGEKWANITGGGTLALAFAKESKDLAVNLGSGFAGGLDISGKGTLKMGKESVLSDNVCVSNGATLAFTSTSALAGSEKTLTVDGAVVDFGAYSVAMGSWELKLENGALITGEGEKNNAMNFNQTGSTIYATSGESIISATTRLDATKGYPNLNYNVSKDAKLTVTGMIHADNTQDKGSITKLGAGTLVLTGTNTHAGTTAVEEGELRINALGALGASSVWVSEGAKLSIETETASKEFTPDRIKGWGTLELMLSSAYDNTLSLGESFQGETYIRRGNMTLNGAQAGQTLRLANGVNLRFNEAEKATWDGNLVLETTSQVHAQEGADFTLTGLVSGAGTYDSRGAGNVHFNGAVKLGSFVQTADNVSTTANFNSETEIGTVLVSKGTVHLNGKTQLGEMTISGGKVQIADEVVLQGNGRMDIQAGGRLLIDDGAKITRTNNVACWIRGSLEVLKEADASFISADDVHVSYDNEGGTGIIHLAEDSSLEMDVRGLYFYTGNSVQLEKGSKLTLTKSDARLSNRGAETATLIASHVEAKTAQQYSMANEYFELKSGHMTANSSLDATLGNQLTRSSLENTGTGSLTVSNKDNIITSLKASGGNVKLAADMMVQSISAASGKSVNITEGQSITMDGGVKLTAREKEASLTSRSDGAMAGLKDGASFTIQDMELKHTTITATRNSPTPVMMQNVKLSQVELNEGAFSLQTAATSVTTAGSGITTLNYSAGISGISNGATLTLLADLSIPEGSALGMVDLEFVLTGFNTTREYATGSLTGLKENYGIEFGGYLGELLNTSAVTVNALNMERAIRMTSTEAWVLNYGAGSGINEGNLVITISGLSIPEPATSTLSLLALAMLCARRKRK